MRRTEKRPEDQKNRAGNFLCAFGHHPEKSASLAYNDRDEVVLDPDRTIVEAISLVFATFRRTGSAMQTLKWFRKNAVTLPSLLLGARVGRRSAW